MVNFNQFLKQAQSMQKKVQEMQDDLSSREYLGQAGGDAVSITINGKGSITKININPSVISIEEKDMLEDLILAAFNDAKNKLDKDSQDAMSNAFGGLNLPTGMKLPF